MRALTDYVRENWRGRDAPPTVRVVEGEDRFLVLLSDEASGTVGRVVAFRDFCTKPGMSMFQIVDGLLDRFEKESR